jgi:hypothetical protein
MFTVGDFVLVWGEPNYGSPGMVTGYGAGFGETYKVQVGEDVNIHPAESLEMLYRLNEGEFIAAETEVDHE